MRIRINNVEYRQTRKLNSEETYDEIVLWYPNPNYGAEEKMKSEGWMFDNDGAHKDNVHYHIGCFKNPESCYTIADVEWNSAHDEFDIRSIGLRAFELNENDYRDFKDVLKHIAKDAGYEN